MHRGGWGAVFLRVQFFSVHYDSTSTMFVRFRSCTLLPASLQPTAYSGNLPRFGDSYFVHFQTQTRLDYHSWLQGKNVHRASGTTLPRSERQCRCLRGGAGLFVLATYSCHIECSIFIPLCTPFNLPKVACHTHARAREFAYIFAVQLESTQHVHTSTHHRPTLVFRSPGGARPPPPPPLPSLALSLSAVLHPRPHPHGPPDASLLPLRAKANVIISFNNFPASDSVPFINELRELGLSLGDFGPLGDNLSGIAKA